MIKRLTNNKERESLSEIETIRSKNPDTWTTEDVRKMCVYLCRKFGVLKEE